MLKSHTNLQVVPFQKFGTLCMHLTCGFLFVQAIKVFYIIINYLFANILLQKIDVQIKNMKILNPYKCL